MTLQTHFPMRERDLSGTVPYEGVTNSPSMYWPTIPSRPQKGQGAVATVTPGSNGRDRVILVPRGPPAHRSHRELVSGSEGVAIVREAGRYWLHVGEVRAVRSTAFVNEVGALLRRNQMAPATTMITTKPITTRTVAPEYGLPSVIVAPCLLGVRSDRGTLEAVTVGSVAHVCGNVDNTSAGSTASPCGAGVAPPRMSTVIAGQPP